jgi:hypothetical protein
MHVQVDPPPQVLEDEIGLWLAAPDEGCRRRPDMNQHATSRFRASIVARARFIENLVVEQAGRGVSKSSGSLTLALRHCAQHACEERSKG